MKNADVTGGNALPNEVQIDLDVLGALMLDGVGGHVDGADVVTVDKSSAAQRDVQLQEKLSKSGDLCNSIGDCSVLGLGTGARDCSLSLGRPRHQVVPQVDCISGGGLPCIRTTGPIGI